MRFPGLMRGSDNDPRVFPAAIGIAVCLVILIFVGVPAGTVLRFMLVGGAFGAVVGWYRVYGQHSVTSAEPPKTEPVPPIPSPVRDTGRTNGQRPDPSTGSPDDAHPAARRRGTEILEYGKRP